MFETYGDLTASRWVLVQPVDEHDRELMTGEIESIRTLCPEDAFSLVSFQTDWFRDLAPWSIPSPFRGQPDFGDGAEETLRKILEEILPEIRRRSGRSDQTIILGGYSLAGFFALWAGYRTDAFAGIAAASPSVWYPGWIEFAEKEKFRASAAYLSLGDREDRTRNPVMKPVGENIRRQYDILRRQGVDTTLQWNEGNHFVDSDRRTALGFAWVTESLKVRRIGAEQEVAGGGK